jgi:hypothetical protein
MVLLLVLQTLVAEEGEAGVIAAVLEVLVVRVL